MLGCTNYCVEKIVDYGDCKKALNKDSILMHQPTALEVLQHVSIVETYPVGEHVFVNSTDSVHTVKEVKALYYKAYEKSAGILAINSIINNRDTIKWIYKTDVCSPTIDN